VARAVHALSGRPGPLVSVNCGALSGTLLDSQLFGHRKGAFTGATRDEPGFVRTSDGGTLFLDEIGDLPAPAQAALLRVLQEREVVPVGSTRSLKVDLRVVAATHRMVDRLAARGDFRSDLYARLSGHVHYLTPLRERREDLGLIIGDILRRIAPSGGEGLKLAAAAGRALALHEWPLNVRELEQGLSRALMLAHDGTLRAHHIVQSPEHPVEVVDDKIDEEDREATLRKLLERHRGNVSEVARAMSKARMQIQRWMRRYGIDAASFR
jgi:transcriptional regulator with GAF, ATPase, and Fis domain